MTTVNSFLRDNLNKKATRYVNYVTALIVAAHVNAFRYRTALIIGLIMEKK